ncbi:MAG: glycoside hydrolase family 32 protein [Candidatus Latescibacteria bacterium]|nr:glycoside hydrolase family 32 protein [Candidatus Latescibacterota bacterium]
MNDRTEWFAHKGWGVFCHWLGAAPSSDGGAGLSAEEWNSWVDEFDVEGLAGQLAGVGAPYLFITIGQNSGHFLAPNPVYDELVGIHPSKCSRRDLVTDLHAALDKRGIDLLVYLPSGAPAADPVAVERLGWQWGFEGSWPSSWGTQRTGKKLADFQRCWEQVMRAWSLQWGTKVKGWWIDGCYFADEMYRHEEEPNFGTFAAALRAGNPEAIVAFNPGVLVPVICHSEHEDYTAGEIAGALPECPGPWVERNGHRARYHVLSYLGQSWCQGPPRFPEEMAVGYTRHVTSRGGVITWDVPIERKGLIPGDFLRQLGAIGAAQTKNWQEGGPVPDAAVRSSRALRERLLADATRPRYHFCVPEDQGMPGDPNGAFYAGGRYHLMYLYSRSGSGFCWGHISSADLLHWRHHPDAIGPGDGDEGCFSGGAFVDEDGTATLSYWMLWGDKGIGLAQSPGPAYETWTKLAANPVIKSSEWGITELRDAQGQPLLVGSADPSNIWKEGGRYYMLTGNLLVLNKVGRAADAPEAEQGDRLYLFVSDDLKKWEYLHVFYQRRPEWTDPSEDNMCPSFLPLPASPEGGPSSGKHLLLFISHNKGCQYYVGTYRDHHFHPETHGRMTWVDNTYFAPEALMDPQGRQIMWSWLLDNPEGDKERGWSGVYGLPRTLWVGEDNTLRLAPVGELELLRGPVRRWRAQTLKAGQTKVLEGLDGTSCELEVEFEVGEAQRCGLKVRAAADGQEQTLIYYDREAQQLVFDATRSGGTGRRVLERAPLVLAPGETLRLRVFVDQSVVEIFANERQAIGRRVYPLRPDSQGVFLFAEGGAARVRRIAAWDLGPTNAY